MNWLSGKWAERAAEMDRRLRGREAEWSHPERQREEAERAAARERERRATVLRELARIDVPPLCVDDIAAGNLNEDSLAIAAVKQGDWRMLVLMGGVGTGKTTAGSYWLWQAVNERVTDGGQIYSLPLLFVTAARLSRWARYDNAQMDRLLDAERLYIDDLGVEFLDEKGAYMALLDEVINHRYGHKRPTAISVNLNPIEFKTRYGQRFVDRLYQIGKVIGTGDTSMRRKATR